MCGGGREEEADHQRNSGRSASSSDSIMAGLTYMQYHHQKKRGKRGEKVSVSCSACEPPAVWARTVGRVARGMRTRTTIACAVFRSLDQHIAVAHDPAAAVPADPALVAPHAVAVRAEVRCIVQLGGGGKGGGWGGRRRSRSIGEPQQSPEFSSACIAAVDASWGWVGPC